MLRKWLRSSKSLSLISTVWSIFAPPIDVTMKNFRFIALFILLTALLTSCKNQEQAQTSGVVFPSTPASKTQPGQNNSTPGASEEAEPRTWLGREIVLETANRLNGRLKADGETASKIKSSVLKSFQDSGGKMEMTYSDAQAKEKAKEVIKLASDAIMPLLNPEQKKTLQSMIDR